MKKFLVLFVALVLSLSLVACSGGDQSGDGGDATAPDEIRIGLVGPMSGPGAQYGAAMKEAAELAVEEINAAGGINGAEVVLFTEDDASVPAQAVSAVEKFITQNEVHVVIGCYNSSCSLAAMEVTTREGVPHINPISTALAITESGSEFIFRNCATNPMQVGTVARYLFKTFPEKTRYAIIHENTDYGIGMKEAFEELLPEFPDIELVAVEAYNPGDTDFYAQLTKIKSVNPDALFFASNLTEGSQIVKQCAELGIGDDVVKFAMGGCSTPEFFRLTEGAATGVYNSSYFEPTDDDPLVKAFVEAYENRWGRQPDMFAAATYEAVYIAKAAVEGAEYVQDLAQYRVNLRDAIRALDALPGVQGGPTTFDEKGQAQKSVLVVQWQADGTKKIVQGVN